MANPLTCEIIKKRIEYLHKNHPNIHVNVKLGHPRESLMDVPATIVEVYPNIFVLAETSKGHEERHTAKYSDVLIGLIDIVEFANFK